MGLGRQIDLTILMAFILLVSPFQAHAQENFNIRADLNRNMVVQFSEEVVRDFQKRIERFNKNHNQTEFFVKIYKDEKDRKFLRRYFKEHGVQGLRPFEVSEARAYSRYRDVVISIGPVEALEHKVKLDDKTYSISSQQGLRSRVVQLEKIVETHLQEKKDSGLREFFSSLFPIRSAMASNDKEKEEGVYSHLLVAALIGATDNLHLHEDVARDFTDKKLHENIKKMVSHVVEKSVNCQDELVVMKKLRRRDQNATGAHIPIASIQDFDTAGSISERLSDMLKRERDLKSFIEMRNALTSHFDVYYTTLADRNMCWGIFSQAYEGGKTNPKLEKACTSFDLLHDCLVEMRSIDRVSEIQRKEVSEKYYKGNLKPRESRFAPKYQRQSSESVSR